MTLPESATRVVEALDGRRVSRVGFGCYRVDDRTPAHREALAFALREGVNLIDTSTNYGDGASERLVGSVLKETGADAVVVTKAGYVQGLNRAEAIRRKQDGSPWPEMTEYSDDCWHCISPEFLRDQLTASLERLQLPKVDVLLLHNPEYFLMEAEQQLMGLDAARDVFYDRVKRALAHLETERTAGRIAAYGISSNTFVVPHPRPEAVDLTRILPVAGPGFRVIQLPMNPLELGAREGIHTAERRSVLDVARDAGLSVLVNRPLNAFGPRGLVRFAEVSPPFELVPADGTAWRALAELEQEFRKRWAPRLRMEPGAPPPEQLIAFSPLFREIELQVSDLSAFASAWESHVAPRLDELLPELERVLGNETGYGDFARRLRQRIAQVASIAVRRPLARESERKALLLQQLRKAFGETAGETISQRTIRALAETPGVDGVLVGMRRTRYVRDALATFS